MLHFLIFLFFFTSVFAQTCKPGESLGPFIPGNPCPTGSEPAKGDSGIECCPTGSIIPDQSCKPGDSLGPSLPGLPCPLGSESIKGPNGDECCPSGSIITPPTPAPTSTTLSVTNGSTVASTVTSATVRTTRRPMVPPIFVVIPSCVDKPNPKTGISDCPSRANLCNDPNYVDVMTVQCPKTCKRCFSTTVGTTSSPGTCIDLVNPNTGISDCPSRASFCNEPTYVEVMTVQCPKTCNRCSLTTRSTTSASLNPGICVDLINPKTGVSDCPARKEQCNDPVYTTVMNKNCPKTCGKCGSTATARSGTMSTGRTITTPSPTVPCVDISINGLSDCPLRRSLCTNPIYGELMREQCPATCGFC